MTSIEKTKQGSEEVVGSVKETGRHEIAIEKSLAAPQKCFEIRVKWLENRCF